MNDRYPIPEFLRHKDPAVRAAVEHPMLFSSPMVRAILAGTKTQTRRIVKPKWSIYPASDPRMMKWSPECPYGLPGDRLWVREGFSGPHHRESLPPSLWHELDEIHYWADGNPVGGDWTRPRPSIHMPRWASRILLEITAVRVERLQDISEADAEAEGVGTVRVSDTDFRYVDYLRAGKRDIGDKEATCGSAVLSYATLWESINGPGSWAANPWVWCLSFRRNTP